MPEIILIHSIVVFATISNIVSILNSEGRGLLKILLM
jgi:hypothetical protein